MKKLLGLMLMTILVATCSTCFARPATDYRKSTPAAAEQVKAYPQMVLELVNSERAKVGSNLLRLDSELNEGAHIRVKELTKNFSHIRANGKPGFTVIKKRGETIAEAIAAGPENPQELINSLLKDEDYSLDIRDARMQELGVAYYYNSDSPKKHYWILLYRGWEHFS